MSSPGDAPKPWALLFTYGGAILLVGAATVAWWSFLAWLIWWFLWLIWWLLRWLLVM
jgi:hypothetical protein